MKIHQDKLEIEKTILDFEIKKRRELKHHLNIINKMIDKRRKKIKKLTKEMNKK